MSLAAIIIPVHNRIRHTLPCVQRLAWCIGLPDWQVIVVDDASTDGTAEALRTQFPQVRIVSGDGSLFWTGGIAAGMSNALAKGATEIVWLNDDTEVDEVSLRRLVGLVREDQRRVIGATAVVAGKVQSHHCRSRREVIAAEGELAPADVLAGFLVAFSSDVPARIGLPDTSRFPHYAGDSAYTHEAHKAGFTLLVDGGSLVRLREFDGYTTLEEEFWRTSSETLLQRLERVFFSTRSRHRLATHWHLDHVYRGWLEGSAVTFARCLWWIARLLRRRYRHTLAHQAFITYNL